MFDVILIVKILKYKIIFKKIKNIKILVFIYSMLYVYFQKNSITYNWPSRGVS